MKSGAFWFGLGVGVTVGSTLALLMAPGPGGETRERVATAAQKVKEALAERGRNGWVLVLAPVAVTVNKSG